MAKISIIVPVYNTRSTLERCINSLTAQTLEDIEIIIVDDGSPDNAGELCDCLAENDKRIKVIHKENGGLSSARNAGMDIACGEYIGFVDSDDYADVTMFEKMYDSAKKHNSDITMCAHYTVNDEGEETAHLFKDCKEIYEKTEIQSEWIEPFIGYDRQTESLHKDGFVCRQIFKSSIAKKQKFKSEREFFAEDIVFDLEIYPLVEKISVVNEPLLYYVFNGDSLSNRYRKDIWKKLDNLLSFEKGVVESLNSESAERRLLDTTLKFIIFSIRNLKKQGCELSFSEKIDAIKKMYESTHSQEMLKYVDCNLYGLKIKVFLLLFKLRLFPLIYFLFR